MNRLQQELQRLYGPQADGHPDPGDLPLVDAQGRVRAMVLELARPADWTALSAVWRGVQADLGLPAPAIAVNGSDGIQLWFSLQAPVPAAQAAAFLDALRGRYLGDVAPARVAMLPVLDSASARPPQHARPVPALRTDSGLWAAFVASDLVPMFADESGLDGAPNPEGQAQLLVPLKSIRAHEFEQALQQLGPAAVTTPPGPASEVPSSLDPRRFLLDVMNDDRLDMALRIEAAKALLPGTHTDWLSRTELPRARHFEGSVPVVRGE